MDTTSKFEMGLFAIEDDYNAIGFHNGQDWNGFACPYFEKEAAIKVLEEAYEYGYFTWEYDKSADTFITVDNMQDDDEGNLGVKEYWNGIDITYEGETIHVYGIGTACWTWDLISCEKINGRYFNIYPSYQENKEEYTKWHSFNAVCIDDENLVYTLLITQDSGTLINDFFIEALDINDFLNNDVEIQWIKQLLIKYSDALIEQSRSRTVE